MTGCGAAWRRRNSTAVWHSGRKGKLDGSKEATGDSCKRFAAKMTDENLMEKVFMSDGIIIREENKNAVPYGEF